MRFADFAALLPVFLGKIVSFPEKTSEDEAGPLLPEVLAAVNATSR